MRSTDALYDDLATSPQFHSSAWFAAPDPRDWFAVWRCGSEFNDGYCNPALDALLDRADAELDPEQRLALYEEAGHMLLADAPAIFVHPAVTIGTRQTAGRWLLPHDAQRVLARLDEPADGGRGAGRLACPRGTCDTRSPPRRAIHRRRNVMRRTVPVVPIFVVIVLVLLLPSLAPVAATQDAGPKVLRMWWAGHFSDELEPQSSQNGTTDIPLLNYEGLTRIDEELNVVPAAAESWQPNEDGSVWTFHLREGLTYSDGTPLTAERFRYAIARQCDPRLKLWDASDLFDIAGCEELFTSLDSVSDPAAAEAAFQQANANLGVRALDARTLEIRLRQPGVYFPAVTGGLGFLPVRQDLIEAAGPDPWLDPATWIGNGPFQLAAIEPNATPPHYTFVANDRYWGGRPKLDAIEWVVAGPDRGLGAYRNGELDVTRPWYDGLPMLEADPVLSRELLAVPSPLVGAFLFHHGKEPFTDPKVREAFAYAFDRDAYCRQVERGACTPQLSWMPPRVLGAVETDAFAFDPVKARQALTASSYGGPENLPEIIWYHYDNAWTRQEAQWVYEQFRQVLGVEMTLRPLPDEEFDALFDSTETMPQLSSTGWYSDLADPHGWMQFWTCGSGYFTSDIAYCNPEYDALVQAADRELDPAKRVALVEESQRVLLAGAPAIFVSNYDDFFLVKPYVTGYIPTAPYQTWPGQMTPLTVDVERPA